MKRLKKLLAVVLSVAMLVSVINVGNLNTTEVKAEEIFTITAPTAGSLLAAGYIDIVWTDASSEGTIKNYSVYVDGALAATTTSTTYEYYTTKVNYHTVWIVANYANGKIAYTDSVRFGVSKKGLGLSTDMGRWIIPKTEFNVAWYYNWGESPSNGSQYEDLEYVPMVWKETSASNFQKRVLSAKEKGYKYILTFNEPDLRGQCNMTVDAVYNAWQGIDNVTGIKVSSPVTAQWPQNSPRWFQTFMNKLDTNSDHDVDFISIHCYPDNYGGAGMAKWFLEEVVDWTWEKYHKPIWVTEFSTTGKNITATGGNGTKEFWEAVMPGLDEREYVERYAAFGFNAKDTPNTGLWWYGSGAPTEGGYAYRDNGNPTTDYVAGKAKNPGATQKGHLVTPVTVKKPAKAKIKSLKNVKKKKIKVTIKKVKNAAGYQVRWSDSKKFNGYWQKTSKKTKYTIKKLDKGTRYYVKVRAYAKNGSKKLYGAWSKRKSVKVKK